MAVIPLLVVLSAEGLLRLVGFGYSVDFFRQQRIDGRAVLTDNPNFGRRFFPPGLERYAEPFTISAAKPPNTVRIFVMGESAAMGDPDFKFGLPKMVEVLLRERFPDRQIEVINTAMVAINSHVILPIARDCAKRQGDLWIIYMGNNEIIGPFGSASIFGSRAPALELVRLGLWLKTTRIGQLLDAGQYWLRKGSQPAPEWAGMEMMADQRVRADSTATERVYSHFERNLKDLLKTGVRAGVPIVLCTVATNLKDCAPFASEHRVGLTAAEFAEWESVYTAGNALQNQGNFKDALAAYERAARIDDKFAELAFRRGECCRLLGQVAEAAKLFRQAREQDALQFRADDRINSSIRRAAEEFASRQVRLADADRLFATNSAQGLVGSDYFYEHVHLTPEGNYLLARAVAEQGAESLALPASNSWVSLPDCLRLLGFTDWNRFDAFNVIYDRIQKAPFTNQLDHLQQLQSINEQLDHYRLATKPAQVRREAAQVSQMVARFPQNPDLRWNLAVLREAAGETSSAEEQWRALIALQPRSALAAFNLGRLLESLGRLAEALQFYDLASRVRPDYYPARYALGALSLRLDRLPEALENLKIAVRQSPASVEAHFKLGQALVHARKQASAEKQFREVLRLDPKNQAARLQLDEIAGGSRQN